MFDLYGWPTPLVDCMVAIHFGVERMCTLYEFHRSHTVSHERNRIDKLIHYRASRLDGQDLCNMCK